MNEMTLKLREQIITTYGPFEGTYTAEQVRSIISQVAVDFAARLGAAAQAGEMVGCCVCLKRFSQKHIVCAQCLGRNNHG